MAIPCCGDQTRQLTKYSTPSNGMELTRVSNDTVSSMEHNFPNALYDFDTRLLHIPRVSQDQITITGFLGRGAFGEVYAGTLRIPTPAPSDQAGRSITNTGQSSGVAIPLSSGSQMTTRYAQQHNTDT